MHNQAHAHWAYQLLKKYLRLTHETLLVRHRYVIGRGRLPARGERWFIACNHENTANDPLNIVFSLPDSLPVGSLARANMFELNGMVTRFLRFLRILPAYRVGWEGLESLDKNAEISREMSRRIAGGEPFIVFPSAGHSQGHYLLPFTTGIVRMALQAIDADGWQHDVKIVPTALFYADYNAPRSDVAWMVGEPISLLPYKDSYPQHQYSIMRAVRDELCARIRQMMLDEGEEDYAEIDFLRRSFSPGEVSPSTPLPDRLAADKAFVASLRRSDHYGMLVALARAILRREERLGVSDESVRRPMRGLAMAGSALLLLLLLPLWVVSLWPHLLCYRLPLLLLKEDKMFTSSYRYIISALFIYPLAALATLVAFALPGHGWLGAAWVLLWVPTGVFCWSYWRRLRQLVDNVRLRLHPYTATKLQVLRARVRKLMDDKGRRGA